MRIVLLDPGLKTIKGHHCDLDLRLGRALRRRGHELALHGSAEPDPELIAKAKEASLDFHATFRISPYARLPRAQSPAEAYKLLELDTAQDLAAVPKADVWVWPTLASYQFAAAAHYAGSMRQIGGVWWLPGFPQAIGATHWAATAHRLAEVRDRFVVGAYDELLCREYQRASPGLDIQCLSCPHDGIANNRNPTSLRRIGFFGHQRAGRGADLIPEMAAALAAKGFEVVVQDSSGSRSGKRRASRIRALSRPSFASRIRRWCWRQKGTADCVTNLPYVEDFASELARCDLVVWPSQKEAYAQSLSGVVSECIATGVPIVVPAGCMPAQVAARYGCGVFFHAYSSKAILAAVDEAARDFHDVTARSRAAAAMWHGQNGTDRLAAWIGQVMGAKA